MWVKPAAFAKVSPMQRKFPLLLASFFLGSALAASAMEKWIYVATNLAVDKNIGDLEALMKRGEAAGYDHILLADSTLAVSPPWNPTISKTWIG